MELQQLAGYVLLLIWFAVLTVSVYAFIHAAMQRSDAYTATGKLTKPVWLLIIGGAAFVALLMSFGGVSVLGTAIAAVAAGVYLVDVRPKILEIQGKSR